MYILTGHNVKPESNSFVIKIIMLYSRLAVAPCEREGEDWRVLKRTVSNVSFLSVCSPEKDCWLSFLAYSSIALVREDG